MPEYPEKKKSSPRKDTPVDQTPHVMAAVSAVTGVPVVTLQMGEHVIHMSVEYAGTVAQMLAQASAVAYVDSMFVQYMMTTQQIDLASAHQILQHFQSFRNYVIQQQEAMQRAASGEAQVQ